jgi:pyridoxine 5-phosphate synthase
MIRLGVNLDHVATLRQARLSRAPDVLAAGHEALLGGADHVVVHLREDRRHVQDRDVRLLREALALPLELEMAATAEMTAFAREVKPASVCLVPERREERTTEGGLSVERDAEALGRVVSELLEAGIAVSLFVDPDEAALVAANALGAPAVELHTGRYADAPNEGLRLREHRALAKAAVTAKALGFRVHAGHGLDHGNVARVAVLPEVEELNIGFSIVARAVFTGLRSAVAEMRARIDGARVSEAPLP